MVTLSNSDLARNELRVGVKPALILVDMMVAFTDPESPLGSSQNSVIEANLALLEAFRERALPVVFTAMVYESREQASVFRARLPALDILVPDSPWVEIDSRLARRDGEALIWKHWASGFFGTNLSEILRSQNVDSLVVTGLTTSGCVRATAVDGLQHNYPTLVASDAVGDRNRDAHESNLHDLHAKYADVKLSAEIIDSLPR